MHHSEIFGISDDECTDEPTESLTADALEQYGFKKDNIHNCYVIHQFQNNVAIEFFDGLIHIVGYDAAEPLEHIKYLHQLESLYLALTGKELIRPLVV